MVNRVFVFLCCLILLASCTSSGDDFFCEIPDEFPIIGIPTIDSVKQDDGNIQLVETAPTIIDFELYAQDGSTINNDFLRGKYYVADFFFANCPSICPPIKRHQLIFRDQVDEAFEETIYFVSHTLDAKRDSVAALKIYAEQLGADQKNWLFLTGSSRTIYDLAKSYVIPAAINENAPGGIDHGGQLVFVDKQGHIRAFADGTNPDSVDCLLEKMKAFIETDN